jgi:hypothetical protein
MPDDNDAKIAAAQAHLEAIRIKKGIKRHLLTDPRYTNVLCNHPHAVFKTTDLDKVDCTICLTLHRRLKC